MNPRPSQVIDQRIPFRPAATTGTGCVLDRLLRSGQHCIDGGEINAGEIFDVVGDVPVRVNRDRRPNNSGRRRLVPATRPDLRGFSQRANAVGGQRPAGELGCDAPAGAQDVAGDCQLVRGCATILRGVMEDEVFQMDEFAIDPQRRAGIGEMGALDPAIANRRTVDARDRKPLKLR